MPAPERLARNKATRPEYRGVGERRFTMDALAVDARTVAA
jgi:hypothetical protein